MNEDNSREQRPDPDAVPPNVERERRFLVSKDWRADGDDWAFITQAYVFASDGYAVRVRRVQREMHGVLLDSRSSVGVKGPMLMDERTEYEFEIDPATAQAIIERSAHVVAKKRYQYISEGQTWDIDVFEGANAGLVVAELEGVAIRGVRKPWWATREVTSDARYSNDSLAFRPVSTWM